MYLMTSKNRLNLYLYRVGMMMRVIVGGRGEEHVQRISDAKFESPIKPIRKPNIFLKNPKIKTRIK